MSGPTSLNQKGRAQHCEGGLCGHISRPGGKGRRGVWDKGISKNQMSYKCITYIFVLFPIPVGVAVIDNLLYAVGGSNRDDGTRSNLNTMERYNPEKDEWEDMPSMHRSRGAASVTALNGCLYAVGGYDSGGVFLWSGVLVVGKSGAGHVRAGTCSCWLCVFFFLLGCCCSI